MKKKLSLLMALLMVLSLTAGMAFALTGDGGYTESKTLGLHEGKFIVFDTTEDDDNPENWIDIWEEAAKDIRNLPTLTDGRKYYGATVKARIYFDNAEPEKERFVSGGGLVLTLGGGETTKDPYDWAPNRTSPKTPQAEMAADYSIKNADGGSHSSIVQTMTQYTSETNMIDEEEDGIHKLRIAVSYDPVYEDCVPLVDGKNKYYDYTIEFSHLAAKPGDKIRVRLEPFIGTDGRTSITYKAAEGDSERMEIPEVVEGYIYFGPKPVEKPVIAPQGPVTVAVGGDVEVVLGLSKGTPGGTWEVSGLPDGLDFTTSGGTPKITGKPTVAGTKTITVKYTDPANVAADPMTFSFTATETPKPALSYNPAREYPVSTAGKPTEIDLVPTLSNIDEGGDYAVKPGTTMPTWLTLDPATGSITGTAPTEEEDVDFIVTYTKDGVTVEAPVKFKVVDPNKERDPNPVTAANIKGYTNEAITPVTPKQSGTTGGTWKISSGTLPKGLEFDPKTGIISGTPTEKGTFTYRVSYTTPKGTFTDVESPEYTITITDRPSNPYGDPDDFTNTYTLTYETNGGNNIGSEKYKKGSVVTLIKVPVRAGYTFDGWFSDADLKTKIEKIEMDGNKTVYAGWKKTETPDVFDNEHFAYIIGYTDGTVRPKNNITRAEVATIFYRLLSEQVRNDNMTTTNSFSDVNSGDWFNVEVSTMAKMGIINGYEDGTFRPQENITRAEFAAIASRFDTKNTAVQDADFADIEGHWGKIEISKAAMNGWITGDPTGNFRPNDKLTRAEAMAIINRVLNRVVESEEAFLPGMKTWSDNADKTMWYYLDVQEATNGHKHEADENGVEKWTELLPNRTW